MSTGRPRRPAPRPPEPILHVDLDAFYASVEVLKDPALAGRPVVVGSPGPRGVVMSASYEARARGLHSAMPSTRARRLCPEAVFVPPDFPSYRAASERFRQVLLSITPLVEPISLDEAFLDVGGATLLFGPPASIAAAIRARVQGELSLRCSVGVAPNKFLAKLGSARAKPDGLLVIRAGEERAFLDPLPVGALWGVGERSADTLGRLGIRTVRELAATSEPILARALGEAAARHLLALARGEDDRAVVPFEPSKSVSHEETYPRDLDDEDEILREILRLCHRVAARLRAEGYRARTVTLKLRLPSFTTLTRSRTLADPTDVATDLYRVAAVLLQTLPAARRRFRLIGVAATGLVPAGAEQATLLGEGRWEDAERALDRIRARFGGGSAGPAVLLDEPGERRGSQGPPPGPGPRSGAAPGRSGSPESGPAGG